MAEQSRPDLVEIHKVLLRMLKATSALCEQYNIRYSLYCGTLLGAVRHGGFIPWDHDADLTMPLQDYRRFLEHANELPSEFFCEYPKNTPDCETLWARVKANNTTFMRIKYAGVNEHNGVGLDIYPILQKVSNKVFRTKYKTYWQMIKDLSAWGFCSELFEQFKTQCAFNYCKQMPMNFSDPYYAFFAEVLRNMRKAPHTFTRKQIIMVRLFQMNPQLFNFLCSLWNKHIQ